MSSFQALLPLLWRHLALYAAAALLYPLLLLLLFALDPLQSALTVYFYRGLTYCAMAALLAASPLWYLTCRLSQGLPRRLSFGHTACALLLPLFFLTWFFSVIPLAWDRSASVMNLAWLYEHPGPVTKAEMRRVLHEIYTDEFDVISRRVQEQLASGNIAPVPEIPDAYEITAQGRRFIESSRLLLRLFKADPRFLYPVEHSRGLTDSPEIPTANP